MRTVACIGQFTNDYICIELASESASDESSIITLASTASDYFLKIRKKKGKDKEQDGKFGKKDRGFHDAMEMLMDCFDATFGASPMQQPFRVQPRTIRSNRG